MFQMTVGKDKSVSESIAAVPLGGGGSQKWEMGTTAKVHGRAST